MNEEQRNPDDLLDRKEAGKYLGVSYEMMAHMAYLGKGPIYFKMGDKKKSPVRYKVSDLEAYLEQKRAEYIAVLPRN